MIKVADVLRLLDQVVDAAVAQWGKDFRYSDRYPANSDVCSYVAPPTKENPDWEPQYDGDNDHRILLNDDDRYVETGPPECSCLVAKMFEPLVDEEAIDTWIAISTIVQTRDRPLDFPDISRGALVLLERIQDHQDYDYTWDWIRKDVRGFMRADSIWDNDPFPFKVAA